MDTQLFDLINLAVGISSLLLGILAGGLSLYFFNLSKESERRASQLLENIKTQTETLQKLTGRWMDKLINYSTQSQPVYSETLTTLMTVIQEMPTRISTSLPRGTGEDAVKREMIVGYIGTYYYAALTNVILQSHVPTKFDVLDDEHKLVQKLLEGTYGDVQIFKNLLAAHGNDLTESRAYSFYEQTENNWLPLIKNFDELYRENCSDAQQPQSN